MPMIKIASERTLGQSCPELSKLETENKVSIIGWLTL